MADLLGQGSPRPESLAARMQTASVALGVVVATGATLTVGPVDGADLAQGFFAALTSADKLRYVSATGPTLAAALLELVLNWGQR